MIMWWNHWICEEALRMKWKWQKKAQKTIGKVSFSGFVKHLLLYFVLSRHHRAIMQYAMLTTLFQWSKSSETMEIKISQKLTIQFCFRTNSHPMWTISDRIRVLCSMNKRSVILVAQSIDCFNESEWSCLHWIQDEFNDFQTENSFLIFGSFYGAEKFGLQM